MKNLIVVILASIFCVNAALAQTSINPSSAYQQDGVTFASPDQAGWVLMKSNEAETIFEKREKNEISTASVKTVKTKTFETEEARLKSFETLKKEELSSLNRDSVHFNYVRFKGSMCLQYDGIFRLDAKAAPKLEYFHIQGYLCPHPKAADSALQIEVSNYSNTRDFSEGFISLSGDFFEKTAFPKATEKTKTPR